MTGFLNRWLMAAFSLLIFLLASNFMLAQDGSANDSLEVIEEEPYVHNPARATLYSALLPGAGQLYNDQPGHRKWWKVPIIYGALGTGVYFIANNQKNYRDWRDNYRLRVDGDSLTIDDYVGIYSDDQLETQALQYRRFTELSYIVTTALYVLQIVDATVDGHLYSFDVSNDLSMHIDPRWQPGRTTGFAGMSLTIKW